MNHKFIGFLFIGVGVISIFYPILCQRIEQWEVDSNIFQMIKYSTFQSQNLEVDDNFSLNNKYLGYIYFPEYEVRRLIVNGTSSSILDQGYVGLFSTSIALDDLVGNVILAGHSIAQVFECLHTISIGSEIVIGTRQKREIYVVENQWEVLDHDFSYFEKINDGKFLTLITCMNNYNKRLIVRARKVDD